MRSTPSSLPDSAPRRRGLLLGIAALVIALVGAITFLVIADDDQQSATPTKPAGPGCSVAVAPTNDPSEAPVFQAPGVRGGCIDLSEYEGRPLVVNFWASYCGPCRDEFPMFKDALEQYEEAGLEVIGVSHDDIDDDARDFADEFGAHWPLALDPDDAISDAYVLRPPGLPHSFFVTRDGTISAHISGGFTKKELDAELKKITARELG